MATSRSSVGLGEELSKAQAIRDIGGGTHAYFVDAAGYRTSVRVITVGYKKYLRTTADGTSKNNLDNLPDC